MSSKGKRKAQETNIALQYTIEKEFDEGGNAKVFFARSNSNGKVVVLKRLDHFDDEKEARFLNELHIMHGKAAAIPGVMPIYDSSEEHYWYTMPEAEPLMKRYENKDLWTAEKIISEFVALLETLEQLHAQGISHRDIKPANLFFLDGRCVFGDFGLVDFPDADTLTHSDRALGSTFTIAPEMKRNPHGADGKLADVYSMAKTLWMLLTRDEKGFDGQYNEEDRHHRLNAYGHLADVHLLDVEKMLFQATSTEPGDRPTSTEFKDKLVEWIKVFQDKELCQSLDWEHLTSRLFNGKVPDSVIYRKPNEIVDVLNEIAKSPAFNHMFTPPRGGLDLKWAEMAAEPGCIKVYATGCCIVIKPKALHFENFEDVRWSYFLLECNPQEKVLGNEYDEWDEFVVEDTPGHYVDGTDSCYGIYDYESGKPLPEGWRGIVRALKGNYLFVMKFGHYNQISETYDGRHTQCDADQFRTMIGVYGIAYQAGEKEGKSEEQILNQDIFRLNPHAPIEFPDFEPSLPSPQKYVDDNYKKWLFTLPNFQKIDGSLEFYYLFKNRKGFDSLFEDPKDEMLDLNGKIVERKRGDLTEILTVRNRDVALSIADNLNQQIANFCAGYDTGFGIAHFEIKWRRVSPPRHLFSKEEMYKVYQEADDRKGGKLVIDEEGFTHILPTDIDGTLYPVCHESFGARSNIVGKYSSLPTFERDYQESLEAWLCHLQREIYVYCDGTDFSGKTESELIKEILNYTLLR